MCAKVKICGITMEEEIECLNEQHVDYGGFVLFPKSKRYVTVEKANRLRTQLDPNIASVAVTVTPDASLVREIQRVGFDILQVHGKLSVEAYEACELPIWYAVNIEHPKEARDEIMAVEQRFGDKITGYVVDGAEYGSGKTFRWQANDGAIPEISCEDLTQIFADGSKSFILAGGLQADNVRQGIDYFSPDIVDVSTGVESEAAGIRQKDADKIKEFIRKVRDNE